jgi:hypothetical protein
VLTILYTHTLYLREVSEGEGADYTIHSYTIPARGG